MLTDQISPRVLEEYKNEKLPQERIDFLIQQANEQLEEIAQNEEIYDSFLNKVKTPKKIDNIILWMLIMSNEYIVEEYIDKFNKRDFREVIPVSDLADLLLYAVHLDKVKNTPLDGFDYFVEYEDEGKDEMDQYAFTNTFIYIQKQKEVPLEF
jgi:hypothetical protein